ncbi:hypothetical protein [Metabacillus niabensis]|uniref:hypothetical protein n=1 Tax=Metabacillus niabensis TaxID=324854 RepID=UPI001CFC0883|nr:hypothetical protein [Metabacillus niabensis]
MFGFGRSEKEFNEDEKYSQDITNLQNVVNKLEIKLSHFDNMFKHLQDVQVHQDVQDDVISGQQISDIYERLQGIYEKDESYTAKIFELEEAIKVGKEKSEANTQNIHKLMERLALLEKKPEDEIKENEEVKIPSKLNRKRKIEFKNKKQLSSLSGDGFNERIQRVGSNENQNHNKRNKKIKQQVKRASMSPSDFITNHYPKGQLPNQITTFNPLKYS